MHAFIEQPAYFSIRIVSLGSAHFHPRFLLSTPDITTRIHTPSAIPFDILRAQITGAQVSKVGIIGGFVAVGD